MLKKLICASLVATSPAAAVAQKGREAAGPAWTSVHSCTVVPAAAVSGAPSAIEIQFQASAPASASIVPAVTAHAIRTKGTGTSGRSAAAPEEAKVTCSGTAVAADAAAQKAASERFTVIAPSGRPTAGWSCTVTGTAEAPRFLVELLLPASGEQGAKWSFGESQGALQPVKGGGAGRVAIVPRGTKVPSSTPVPCAASKGRSSGYDLAVGKKA
jgi:hypothetical protein